ncbi:magnesium transporter CorA family protein [Exiguobacterium antarcticum]|uniref:magnesium transporter CorA family protein n=1 Tax=Exiguobacterium antarcticum TaxID=132920 RepID=UPI000285ED16|nr:magnesium transporter CorA family protein [Exiguobacterium antarcticum]AFS69807.1 Magnesium transport protein CorA [Exiguobacterium antarcticum B7]
MESNLRFNWHRYPTLAEYEKHFSQLEHTTSSKLDWLTELRTKDMNFTRVELDVLYGSIVTWQNPDDKSDRRSICYYVSPTELITIGLSDHTVSLVKPYQATTPFEAFYSILALQMNTYFNGIDAFETELFLRQDELRGSIDENSLDSIFGLRDTIENWSDLIVPFRELVLAGPEAFIRHTTYSDAFAFRLAEKRVERLLMLIEHYQKDIEVLLDLSTTVSNFRGNEIMKALTIFTAVATPMMALGAIWGMNFKNMPELDWKYGYASSLFLIFLTTGGIFYWMKRRGWLGALVRMPNKKSSVKK